jgi:hypothetical protein
VEGAGYAEDGGAAEDGLVGESVRKVV